MARPKKKSMLVDGIAELVDAIRAIHVKLDGIIKQQKKQSPKRGPGRPPKAGKRGPGRPAGKRGPGRPAGKRGPGRPPKRKIVEAVAAPARKRGRPRKAA